MWFKQAAASVWEATKNIVSDKRSPSRKLLDEIFESQQEIIPTTKLNQLANLTYDLESFQEIVDICIARIRVFKYDLDEARKNLNMLIVINYLLKHGATAFVDQLRQYVPTFKKYQTLQELKTYEDQITQNALNYELQKIKSRAQHIQTLLQDKQKLLKEKELSMLIKQKLKLYEKQKGKAKGDYSSRQSAQSKVQVQSNSEMDQKMNKINWMMEKYLWKYIDKLDDKLEETSEKIMKKVDQYLIGEIPEKFELQDQTVEHPNESPAKLSQNNKPIGHDKDDDLMKKLEAQIGEGALLPEGANSNLLQFEQFEEEAKKEEKPEKNEDLI